MRHGSDRASFSPMNGPGIAPDIMMVAKGIGGGFPLGAVLATEGRKRHGRLAPMVRPMAATRSPVRSATR